MRRMIWANIFITKHLWNSLYRDVLKLSTEDQGLWKSARTMKRQIVTETKVWELVDLPKGHHTIKGRWFSAVESDDCKIARLVTHQYIHTDLRNRLWRNFLSSHKSWNNSTSFVISNASRLGNRSTRCQNRLPIPLASWMRRSIQINQRVFHSTGSGEKVYRLKDVQLWTTAVCPPTEQATAWKTSLEIKFLWYTDPRVFSVSL